MSFLLHYILQFIILKINSVEIFSVISLFQVLFCYLIKILILIQRIIHDPLIIIHKLLYKPHVNVFSKSSLCLLQLKNICRLEFILLMPVLNF